MSKIAFIGRYQLENLLRQRIGFAFLDLRDISAETHPLLEGSRKIAASEVVEKIRGMNLPNHAPIVLICENGAKSLVAARALEENSFLNVYVVEGGMASLSATE